MLRRRKRDLADALTLQTGVVSAVRPLSRNSALIRFEGSPRIYDVAGRRWAIEMQDRLQVAFVEAADGKRKVFAYRNVTNHTKGSAEARLWAGYALLIIGWSIAILFSAGSAYLVSFIGLALFMTGWLFIREAWRIHAARRLLEPS